LNDTFFFSAPQLKRDPLGGRSVSVRTVFRIALLATYLAAALLASGVTAAGLLTPPGSTLHSLGSLAFLLAPVLAVAIVIHAARFPSRGRIIQASIVIGVGLTACIGAPELRPASRQLYFRHRQADYQRLADQTLASPIRSFLDAGEEWAILNDRYVALADTYPPVIDIYAKGQVVSLDSALHEYRIAPSTFYDVRARLRSLHADMIRTDSVAVAIGGRDAGFVYVPPSAAERATGDVVGGRRLVAKLGERWFYAYW